MSSDPSHRLPDGTPSSTTLVYTPHDVHYPVMIYMVSLYTLQYMYLLSITTILLWTYTLHTRAMN